MSLLNNSKENDLIESLQHQILALQEEMRVKSTKEENLAKVNAQLQERLELFQVILCSELKTKQH